eukprot:tig00000792_g4214.t1
MEQLQERLRRGPLSASASTSSTSSGRFAAQAAAPITSRYVHGPTVAAAAAGDSSATALADAVWLERELFQGEVSRGAIGSHRSRGRCQISLRDADHNLLQRLPLDWRAFFNELFVHVCFPFTLPYLFLQQGTRGMRSHAYWGPENAVITVINIFFGLSWWFSTVSFLFLLTPEERSLKSTEYLAFFAVSTVRPLMVAVKYGYRAPDLARKAASRGLSTLEARSEEAIFGWLPLRFLTALREVDLACIRAGFDPAFPVPFANTPAEVLAALELAALARPEDAARVRALPGGGTAAPARLWVLQQVLEASPSHVPRRQSGSISKGAAGGIDERGAAAGARRTRLAYLELPKLVLTLAHCAIPYLFSEIRAVSASRPVLLALSCAMLTNGFLSMYFFVTAFFVSACVDYHRRYTWVRAAGRLLIAGRATLSPPPGTPAAASMASSSGGPASAAQGRPAPHTLEGGAGAGRGPGRLRLDLRRPAAAMAWLRLRAWAGDVGRSFHLRIQFFLSCFALLLAAQMAFFGAGASAVGLGLALAPAHVHRYVYAYIAYNTGLVGAALVACVYFGAGANELAVEHAFLLHSIRAQLAEQRVLGPADAPAGPVDLYLPPNVGAEAERRGRGGPPPGAAGSWREAGCGACGAGRGAQACACSHALELAQGALELEDRLRPVALLGMRMDEALLRSLLSAGLSALTVALSLFQGDALALDSVLPAPF